MKVFLRTLGIYRPEGGAVSTGCIARAAIASFSTRSFSHGGRPNHLAQLAPGLSGRLLIPADAEYDEAQRVCGFGGVSGVLGGNSRTSSKPRNADGH